MWTDDRASRLFHTRLYGPHSKCINHLLLLKPRRPQALANLSPLPLKRLTYGCGTHRHFVRH